VVVIDRGPWLWAPEGGTRTAERTIPRGLTLAQLTLIVLGRHDLVLWRPEPAVIPTRQRREHLSSHSRCVQGSLARFPTSLAFSVAALFGYGRELQRYDLCGHSPVIRPGSCRLFAACSGERPYYAPHACRVDPGLESRVAGSSSGATSIEGDFGSGRDLQPDRLALVRAGHDVPGHFARKSSRYGPSIKGTFLSITCPLSWRA